MARYLKHGLSSLLSLMMLFYVPVGYAQGFGGVMGDGSTEEVFVAAVETMPSGTVQKGEIAPAEADVMPTPKATPAPQVILPLPTFTSPPVPSDWSINVYYYKDQVVCMGESYYRCLQAHTSVQGWEPGVNGEFWEVKEGKGAGKEEAQQAKDPVAQFPVWEAGKSYHVAEEVYYEGKVYTCLLEHTSQVGWEPSKWPALWQVEEGVTGEAVPAYRPSGEDGSKAPLPEGVREWSTGSVYAAGDSVIYKGGVYQCLQPHTSLEGWEPDITPALWEADASYGSQSHTGFASPGPTPEVSGVDDEPTPDAKDYWWLTSNPEEFQDAARESQGSSSGASQGNKKPSKNIVGYYTEWSIYGAHQNYEVGNIPWDKITHINYAFAKTTNGRVGLYDSWAAVEKPFGDDRWDTPLKGNLGQLIKFKQQYPNVKTLISVGGWTLSGEFHGIASKSTSRKVFADSCVDFIRKYKFDGVDIDWEYPGNLGNNNPYGPEDKHNFTLLLRDVRNALDAAEKQDNKEYLLTIAAPAGYDKIDDTEPNLYHPYLDFINLMTYDIHGAWETTTNHHAPLYKNPKDPSEKEMREKYNTDWAVKEYIRLGVPANKLNVGVPYYSRGWKDVDPGTGTNGLYAKANGAPMGAWDDFNSGPTGTNPFYHIKNTFLKDPGYKVYRDSVSKVPWLYNPEMKHVYTYEDEISLEIKCDYINDNKLGGVMFWEFSGDYPVKGSTLTNILYQKLK